MLEPAHLNLPVEGGDTVQFQIDAGSQIQRFLLDGIPSGLGATAT